MDVYKKEIGKSEEKWTFIQVRSKTAKVLPEKFKVTYNDKVFRFKINGVGRIVSKKFFLASEIRIGDIITLEKNGDRYSIRIKQGIKRRI